MDETEEDAEAIEPRPRGHRHAGRDRRTDREILLSIEAELADQSRLHNVYLQNANMPFSAMIGLVIKFWFASALALLLMLAIAVVIGASLGGVSFAGLKLLR